MITYSAIEVDSPSLVIIMKIAKAGPLGMRKVQLEREMNNSILIEPRVGDLITDKMAKYSDGKYYLKTKGILMARIFLFWRSLMGVGKGG